MKNKYLRIVAFVVCIYSLSFAFVSVLGLFANGEYLYTNDYFKSSRFENRLNNYADEVVEYLIDYKDYDKKTDSDKVKADEVSNAMERNKRALKNAENEINNRYDYQIDNAIHNGNNTAVETLNQQKNKELEEAKTNYDKTEAQVIKQLVKEKDENYFLREKAIANEQAFSYYLVDKNNKIYTNAPVDIIDIKAYIKSNTQYVLTVPSDNNNQIVNNSALLYGYNRIDSNGLRGYIMVLQESPGSDVGVGSVNYEIQEFHNIRQKYIDISVITIVLFILSLVMGLILRKNRKEDSIINKVTNKYSKVFIEIRIIIFLIMSTLAFKFVMSTYSIKSLQLNYIYFAAVLIITIFVFYLIICIKNILEFTEDKEKRQLQFKRSLILKIFVLIKESFIIKRIAVKVLIIMILTVLFGISLSAFLSYYSDDVRVCALVYCILYLTCIPAYVIIKTTYLNKIILGTEKIAGGDLNYVLPEKGKNIFSRFAYNINNMKDGFKVALRNEIKSERLKTELITNVSHDLKTPLTSIVSYINLLKNGELSKEETKDYVEILDRKAQKLKILIEDLFEASKMTSGSVELNIEKVDVVALLKQTLGEYDEKISKSNLQFKVNILSSNIYSMLDGKKTWRVFDNLINNILKYSQQNTRVYINVEEEPEKVKIIMKNISSYEMDFAPEEIFERFKRGDKARTTEGSGLGLAIAKSIVELQDGKLNIEIDGDLFKATVEFKKV